eukprot:CAMPEP_0180540288 /NCGR_PEP_ID=MMETSP1036_2-20121128/67337_1 /TAXON_ID=632150 /ORGANISM="Azadinium spinosum, Strain 3D9" /LENGTH=227 /DNA_ID=CAMNT_0022555075 /DNA_START=42 /DNA_END=722 /DNA_ORIENTATION=+
MANEDIVTIAPRREMACANKNCEYLVHSSGPNGEQGPFCCGRCYWYHIDRGFGKSPHGEFCEHRLAPEGVPRAIYIVSEKDAHNDIDAPSGSRRRKKKSWVTSPPSAELSVYMNGEDHVQELEPRRSGSLSSSEPWAGGTPLQLKQDQQRHEQRAAPVLADGILVPGKIEPPRTGQRDQATAVPALSQPPPPPKLPPSVAGTFEKPVPPPPPPPWLDGTQASPAPQQ